jgi:hypothetical protein
MPSRLETREELNSDLIPIEFDFQSYFYRHIHHKLALWLGWDWSAGWGPSCGHRCCETSCVWSISVAQIHDVMVGIYTSVYIDIIYWYNTYIYIYIYMYIYILMVISWNRATPKSSIYRQGFSTFFTILFEVPPFMETSKWFQVRCLLNL